MANNAPDSAQASKDLDDGGAANQMTFVHQQMDGLFVLGGFVAETFFPGRSVYGRVPEQFPGVTFEAESHEATAHGAFAIEEDDV